MLSNAVAFYGYLALLFTVGVHADTNVPEMVENCKGRIDECKQIATTDAEIIMKEKEILGCFMSFICKEGEDEHRVKTLMGYGGRIAMADIDPSLLETWQGDELDLDPAITIKPSNLAVIVSFSYKTMVAASAVAVFLLA